VSAHRAIAPSPAARAPLRTSNPQSASSRPLEGSTLAEENGLLRRALSSSRSGDDELAVNLHDSLIARYPRSPLAQNAELERLRALSRLGDVSATRSAARRYLARYPDGMGAEEARRLLLEPGRAELNLGKRR
jgi:outer membrane protein assembly factor BamD (BamD/ComL family)